MSHLATASITLLLLASSEMVLAGDAQRGAQVFRSQCSMCHSDARNGAANFGPNLFGVVGRKRASVIGFDYSAALKASPVTWDLDRLRDFVESPTKAAPGARMPYAGLQDPDAREDLIAYLATLK